MIPGYIYVHDFKGLWSKQNRIILNCLHKWITDCGHPIHTILFSLQTTPPIQRNEHLIIQCQQRLNIYANIMYKICCPYIFIHFLSEASANKRGCYGSMQFILPCNYRVLEQNYGHQRQNIAVILASCYNVSIKLIQCEARAIVLLS